MMTVKETIEQVQNTISHNTMLDEEDRQALESAIGHLRRMEAALTKIEKWHGEVPLVWDRITQQHVPYSLLYGSNGERDYMRDVASAALGKREEMNKKSKVWIVTTGCYSDYSVQAVCSSLKQANRVAEMHLDANTPEGFVLDEWVEQAAKGKKLYLCWCHRETADIDPSWFPPKFESPDLETKDGQRLRLFVWAVDDQSAAKIANEKRSMWLAGNLPVVHE